ncbi:hypothetical protein [Pseudoalteromonas sp. MMG022]|uniref:hypothetical protein n=1 Tax=Pseudoalteromonas sp. MMG022 TaxID=2909978 RepID=UPI001F3BADC2|nr:hypothetical protein [Pseudoalteromonas sp. MMG022]MCF6435549.1 hypothetical protein [Pseudoalteromonas sp. MMG022]
MKLLKTTIASKKRSSLNGNTGQATVLSAKVLANKELLMKVSGARGAGVIIESYD